MKLTREILSLPRAIEPEVEIVAIGDIHGRSDLLDALLDEAAATLEFARSRARTGERAFSCWRFLEVSGRGMLSDIATMAQHVGDEPAPEPEFFSEVRRLLH